MCRHWRPEVKAWAYWCSSEMTCRFTVGLWTSEFVLLPIARKWCFSFFASPKQWLHLSVAALPDTRQFLKLSWKSECDCCIHQVAVCKSMCILLMYFLLCFRWSVPMAMSITHRGTGLALSGGNKPAFKICCWMFLTNPFLRCASEYFCSLF